MKRVGAKFLTLVPGGVERTALVEARGVEPEPVLFSKPTLWIRTAAGPTIGFGHLRRSLILGRMLSDSVIPFFLCDPADSYTQNQVIAHGWKFALLDAVEKWSDLSSPAALLIDTRAETGVNELISEARLRSIPVISIHDLGLNPLPSDIVVDGSIAPAVRDFPLRDTIFYVGTPYLVLEPGFSMVHQVAKRVKQRIGSVVINLGGGDSSSCFVKVLQGLREWQRDLEVIGFPGFTNWAQEELARRDWKPLRFRWAAKHESVEKTLFRADVAITAGGLSAFEALCVGTPLMALSHDALQETTTAALKVAGACVDLGRGDSLQPSQIPEVLKSLDESPMWREQLSFRGRQMVDGQGAERVSQVVRQLIFEGNTVFDPAGAQ